MPPRTRYIWLYTFLPDCIFRSIFKHLNAHASVANNDDVNLSQEMTHSLLNRTGSPDRNLIYRMDISTTKKLLSSFCFYDILLFRKYVRCNVYYGTFLIVCVGYLWSTQMEQGKMCGPTSIHSGISLIFMFCVNVLLYLSTTWVWLCGLEIDSHVIIVFQYWVNCSIQLCMYLS